MGTAEKIERRSILIVLHVLMIFMVGFGYFVLSLGLKGQLDFGNDYPYYNKILWFFGSIILISAASLLVKYRKFRYNVLSFIVTFMSQYFGYTMTQGVAFDASRGTFTFNISAMAQTAIGVFIFAIILLIAFYVLYRSKSNR